MSVSLEMYAAKIQYILDFLLAWCVFSPFWQADVWYGLASFGKWMQGFFHADARLFGKTHKAFCACILGKSQGV
jgi:hypothetical protein